MPSPNSTEAYHGKRDKYTRHACDDCQRRKIKCSGATPCSNCALRRIDCRYSTANVSSASGDNPGPPAKRKRASADTSATEKDTPPPPAGPSISPREIELLQQGIVQLQQKIGLLLTGNVGSTDLAVPDSDHHDAGNATRHGSNNTKTKLPIQHPRPSNAAEGHSPAPERTGEQREAEQAARTRADCAVYSHDSAHAIEPLIRSLRLHGGPLTDVLPLAATPQPPRCTISLVPREAIGMLMDTFYEEMDCYFPHLITDRAEMDTKITCALNDASCDAAGTSITVPPRHSTTMAILCTLVAFGQSVNRQRGTETMNPELGIAAYHQSRKLVDEAHSTAMADDGSDLLLYHTLAAALTFATGKWRLSSYHMLQGLHTRIQMPKAAEQQYGCGRPADTTCKVESAWHTLTYLDKRLAQLTGSAYIIDDDMFPPTVSFLPATARDARAGQDGVGAVLLANMAVYDKLWVSMWHQFLAPNASDANDWVEMQAFDAKILASQQLTPPELKWRTATVDKLLADGEPEISLRRRLSVELRWLSLRLKLWRRPLPSASFDELRSRLCFSLAAQVVDAIAKYLDVLPVRLSSFGQQLTTSLTEAIYHIVLEYRNPKTLISSPMSAAALRAATKVLYQLAQVHRSAQDACQSLRGVLLADDDPGPGPLRIDNIEMLQMTEMPPVLGPSPHVPPQTHSTVSCPEALVDVSTLQSPNFALEPSFSLDSFNKVGSTDMMLDPLLAEPSQWPLENWATWDM